MSADEQLLARLGAALARAPQTPPEERVLALRAAVDDARRSGLDATAADRRGWRWNGWLAAAGAAAAAAAGAVVAVVIVAPQSPGALEYTAQLAAGLDVAAQAEVRLVDTGRIVQLHSNELQILPTGEFYEVWFVAADDRPGDPARISAGTFHPDAQGRTDVELLAAVNPELFPTLVVTAEPGDGDPGVGGPEVLRFDLTRP